MMTAEQREYFKEIAHLVSFISVPAASPNNLIVCNHIIYDMNPCGSCVFSTHARTCALRSITNEDLQDDYPELII